jgi:hypothetical protein
LPSPLATARPRGEWLEDIELEVRPIGQLAVWRRCALSANVTVVRSSQTPLFYIVDWLPPDFGAVGQYGQLFAREIAQGESRKVFLIGLTSGPASVEQEIVGGGELEITRINAVPYEKEKLVKRLLWTIRTNFRLIREVMRNPASHGAEVLFTGAPPFMLFFTVPLKLIRRLRLIYRITDFYPEVIIAELGRRSILLRLLQSLTWFLRRQVDLFQVLGEDQRQILINGGITPARISIKRDRSPVVWTRNETPLPSPPELIGRKVLLYSGNYGLAHDTDTVIEGLVRHHRYGSGRFGIWLNASGQNADIVARRLALAQIPVARSRPAPLDSLGALLAAADVHLITLRTQFSGIVLPSKIYACVESRRPILFVGPATSDIHLLCTQNEQIPYRRIEPGDSDGFAAALEYFANQDARTIELNATSNQGA